MASLTLLELPLLVFMAEVGGDGTLDSVLYRQWSLLFSEQNMGWECPLLGQVQGLSLRWTWLLLLANNCVDVHGYLHLCFWPGSHVSKIYSAGASRVLQMIDLDVI